MKKVFYKKRDLFQKRVKIVQYSEKVEETDCVSHITKRFVYVLNPGVSHQQEGMKPDIQISKGYDSVHECEYFTLHVRGVTQIEQGRKTFRVDFAHSLKIEIDWKTKLLSPEQSATVA